MPLKILIAEDDQVMAQLVAAVVRQAGHVPTHAYDAMQTMMFAMRIPAPALIILDINMPGGTGIDALLKLKRSAKTAHIPVVVVSGSIDPSLPAKAIEAGAVAFLPKPIDPVSLKAAIQEGMG